MKTITLPIQGMTCAACAQSIEERLRLLDGIKTVAVQVATEQVYIEYEEANISIATIEQEIKRLGYTVAYEEIDLDITGMTCAACSGRIERVLNRTEGVDQAAVNLALETGKVRYNPNVLSEHDITKRIAQLGFEANVHTVEKGDHREAEIQKRTRLFWVSFLFTIPLFWTMFDHFSWTSNLYIPSLFLNPYVQWGLASVVQFGIGWIFYRGAFFALRNRSANMDVLVALGTSAAYFYSVYLVFTNPKDGLYFETSAMLITLILLGKVLEARAKGKSSAAIEALLQLQPNVAVKKIDDTWQEVPTEHVNIGDQLLIRPGSVIPVDGRVVEGHSTVNESMLTGESLPVSKKENALLYAATLNGNGSLTMEATNVGDETVLAQIIQTVEEAQSTKAPIQRLADKISSVFVPIVITLSLITFLVWFFIVDSANFAVALRNAIAVLVIACPCALGLATPTSIMAGSGRAAEYGILFRTAETMEQAHHVDTIVFDKTGTLTKGSPEVVDVETARDWTVADIFSYVYPAEIQSEHALARAITRYMTPTTTRTVEHFRAIQGHGIEATVDGSHLLIGNRALLETFDIPLFDPMDEWKQKGATVVYVALNAKHVATLGVRDEVKPSSIQAVETLKGQGYDLFLLTGDDHLTARTIAHEVGIHPNRIISDVLPNEKADVIRKLMNEKRSVAMVGDGINDAPALAIADIGIAMSSGTNVAIEAADITVIHDDMMRIPQALQMSEKTVRNIHQNLFWALGYNSLGIPIAAAGFLAPWVAGAAMAFSSISVVLNALRLQRTKL